MAIGTRSNTLKLAGFIESSNVVIYSSCHFSLSKDLLKILRLLAVFQMFLKLDCADAELFRPAPALFCMYRSRKKMKNIGF